MGYVSERNPGSTTCISNDTKEIKAVLSDIGIETRIVE